MGSGPSKMAGAIGPAPSMTRQQLLAKTEGSRDYVNLLFNQMIGKLTPEDYLKLGNPQTCQKFIFMMAENLQKHFMALRIRPAKAGDSGILYFQQVDRLSGDRESRELCLVIAYFFIRLFQIFGALAITCLDDPGAGQTLGVLQAPPVAPRPVGVFGRPAGPRFGPGAAIVERQRGGGLSGSFVYLRSILTDTSEANVYQFNVNDNITLHPYLPYYKLQFNMGNSIKLGTTLSLERETPKSSNGKFTITIPLIVIKGLTSRESIILKDYLDIKIKNKFVRNISKDRKKLEFKIEFYDNSIKPDSFDIINDNLFNIYRFIEESIEEYRLNPDAAQKKVREYAAQRRELIPGIQQAYNPDQPKFIAGPLMTDYLINTLKSVKTQKIPSFCVARALQLIDASSLAQINVGKTPNKISSTICFDGDSRITPATKTSLSKVYGLRALDSLYKTQPHIKAAQEGSSSMGFEVDPDSDAEYANFLAKVSSLFGPPQQQVSAKGLGDITSRPSMCQTTAVKRALQIEDPRTIQDVVKGVNQMFGMQFKHTQDVMKFFSTRLFLIKKVRNPITGGTSEYIEIHPRILKGGIAELTEVSKAARELLLRYYSFCEEKYSTLAKAISAAQTRAI
jgi:hypothetical protein